ncbi:MAG TPA: vitamin K epoxide reductase family protein [Vicinamibacterales bacterium]
MPLLLSGFAVLGLAASLASTWVHYRILNDPTYASFCDVNATFSCTEAYTSRFGAVAGVPIAVFGALFFVFVLGLVLMSAKSSSARENVPGYVFALSTVGLAAVLYLAYASYFILNVVCLLCVGTYVAVIGLFIVSGMSTRYPMTNLPSRAAKDLRVLMRTPSALTALVVFVAVSVAAIALFPEQRVTAAANESAADAPAAQAAQIPAASASQLQQLEQFLAAQPRVPVMVPSDGADVVVVKFNDYQCPACGQTYRDSKPVVAKWLAQAPGKVKFITKDYPLERECNQFVSQDLHPGACEAAVAVRLAREKGRGEAMEDWLFANQAALTPESVKNAALTVGQVKDFDARYAATLELVKADIAQGAQLKISGTPTFFMNGMRLPGLRAEFFDAAIAWELKRASGGK